jgi:hypothetical protein
MPAQAKIICDLGNDLIMRRSTPVDADALSAFNGEIHSEDEVDKLRLINWTRDLLTRPHPTFTTDNFTIIEESTTGRIVSSSCLIPQTWSYEGIEFGVGRPELIGTLSEYRGKGLVRVQFDEIHKWCMEHEMPVQAITGIPYFYRQFGYEMALDLDGGKTGYEPGVPKLKDGESEKFRIRRAVENDIPFIMEVYEKFSTRQSIVVVRDEAMWKYELIGRSEESIPARKWEIIERIDGGEMVGLLMRPKNAGNYAMMYELKSGSSWLEVTPSIVRHLWKIAREMTAQDGSKYRSFTFLLGQNHPVYQVMGDDLPSYRKPYAYFIRIPDMTGFIRHITPALEYRLASSIAPGYSGELKFSFYKNGMRLLFEEGKLVLVEDWRRSANESRSVAFPDLTFLQVLFGYRSFSELHQSFADCWWRSEKDHALINILFPKKQSNVIGIA